MNVPLILGENELLEAKKVIDILVITENNEIYKAYPIRIED